MFFKSIVFILFLSFSSVYAQDGLTIVAVGEAEIATEKILFESFQVKAQLKDDEKRAISELLDLLNNDFSFYKHWFEVVDSTPYTTGQNFKVWKEKSLNYVFKGIVKYEQNKFILDYTFFDVNKEKLIIEKSVDLLVNNIREFGHKLADEIYQSIKSKPSIFTKKIFFVSDRSARHHNANKELYQMDFDGKRIRRLTYHNSMLISPSVSPDNQKVLYTLIENRWRKASNGKLHKVKNLNLYILDLKTNKTSLLSDGEGINSGAIFTHDPNKIYLTLSHTKNADIFEMNLLTKATRRITNHFSDDVDPNINESGELMTFLSGRSGKAMIYILDPSGLEKSIKRISFVGQFNASPHFSPDGKEITFSSWVDERFDIYKINSDGRNLVRLTKNFGSNEEASFSPDGEFILFTSQRVISSKKAVQDLYIMNKQGEVIKKLTSDFGKCFTPRWSN